MGRLVQIGQMIERLINPKSEGIKSHDFELRLCSAEEKSEIENKIRLLGRQTMNLRKMPDAEMLSLRDMSQGEKLIGWCGISTRFNPDYPEFFSLHLEVEYRSFLLGILLDYARAKYTMSQGFDFAFLRMTRDQSSRLLQNRRESGCYELMNPENLDPGYRDLCQSCELFGNKCAERDFLKINLPLLVAFGERRLGRIDFDFPLRYKINPKIIRKLKQNPAA